MLSNYTFIILTHNAQNISYLKDSYNRKTQHYTFINKSKNHYDYFLLLSCCQNSSILFLECSKNYEVIAGYSGIGNYDFAQNRLNYTILQHFTQNEAQLSIIEELNINIKLQFETHNLVINIPKTQKPYRDNNINSLIPDIKIKQIKLEYELYRLQPVAFNKYYEIRQKYYFPLPITSTSIMTFHAIIGSKNNDFADCVNNNFPSYNDFIEKWEEGLYNNFTNEKLSVHPNSKGKFEFLIRLFQHPDIQKYIYTFLERNYYRNYKERTRVKPSKELTEIFIGNNTFMLQLLITPVFRKRSPKELGHWENDISEIRRSNFTYWTIKHLLSSGYIYNNCLYKIKDMQDIYNLYMLFYKNSKSIYEKDIIIRYIYYLKEHTNENIPLLIPEFRYGGSRKKHIYRLDFLIINIPQNQIVGIELSPNYHIVGDTDAKIIEKWEYEIAKRNKYFDNYNIVTKTFTSSMLSNLEECWSDILLYLKPIEEFSNNSSYNKLMSIKL